MAELYEVLLVDRDARWHVGWLMDDETETDLLLAHAGKVLLFGSRAALEHHAQEHELELVDDLPDEIDLDLGGWLSTGSPLPTEAEVLALWQLLVEDPIAGRALTSEEVEEAYDDLAEEVPGWFDAHGAVARPALTAAVARLRGAFRKV